MTTKTLKYFNEQHKSGKLDDPRLSSFPDFDNFFNSDLNSQSEDDFIHQYLKPITPYTAKFRDAEVAKMIKTLSRKMKSNIFLIGDAGTGKTSLANHLAYLINEKDPRILSILGDDIEVYELVLQDIVSGKTLVGQTEEATIKIIEYLKNHNTIVFIDEIHQLFDPTTGNQFKSIAQHLKPFLASDQSRVIGATTTSEYNFILKDPAFNRRFECIRVREFNLDETVEIMNFRQKDYIEHYQNLNFQSLTHNQLSSILLESEHYKKAGGHRPDTALTLMDSVLANLSYDILSGKKTTFDNTYISNIARSELTSNQITIDQLDKLNENFKQIIGQEHVKEDVKKAIRRLARPITRQTKPTVFMFAGPSGTGKTFMGQLIAESMFGSKNNMIYINMSEYSDKSALNKIVGSPTGYVGSNDTSELPLDSLNNNPFQVILLDEFEKADDSIKQFWMQAFDDGKIRINRNNASIDTSKAIFILTTNAAAKPESSIGFNNDKQTRSSEDVSKILSEFFSEELLNKIEYKFVFENISKDQYKDVMIAKYNQIVKEAQQSNPTLNITPKQLTNEDTQLDNLINQSYNRLENARPAYRTILRYVSDKVIETDEKDIDLFKE